MSLLLSTTKGRNVSETNEDDSLRVRNSSDALTMPMCDLRFGIAAQLCSELLSLMAAVGYELHYLCAGQQTDLYSHLQNPAVNRLRARPFSVDGFYFRLGAAY